MRSVHKTPTRMGWVATLLAAPASENPADAGVSARTGRFAPDRACRAPCLACGSPPTFQSEGASRAGNPLQTVASLQERVACPLRVRAPGFAPTCYAGLGLLRNQNGQLRKRLPHQAAAWTGAPPPHFRRRGPGLLSQPVGPLCSSAAPPAQARFPPHFSVAHRFGLSCGVIPACYLGRDLLEEVGVTTRAYKNHGAVLGAVRWVPAHRRDPLPPLGQGQSFSESCRGISVNRPMPTVSLRSMSGGKAPVNCPSSVEVGQ